MDVWMGGWINGGEDGRPGGVRDVSKVARRDGGREKEMMGRKERDHRQRETLYNSNSLAKCQLRYFVFDSDFMFDI